MTKRYIEIEGLSRVFTIILAIVTLFSLLHPVIEKIWANKYYWLAISGYVYFFVAIILLFSIFSIKQHSFIIWVAREEYAKGYLKLLESALDKINILLSSGERCKIDKKITPLSFYWSTNLFGLTILIAIIYPISSLIFQWLIMGNEIILGNVKVFERLDNPYEKILLTVFSFFGIFIFLKSIISSAKNSSIYLSTIGLIILTGIMIFSFTNSWNTVLTIQVSIILISSIIYIVNNLTFNLSDSSKEIIALPISAVGAFLACISIGGLIGEIDTISVLGISLVAIAITINSGVASIGALISFFSISLVSFIFNLGLIKISIVGSFSGVFLALGVISTLKFYSVLMSDYIDIKSKKVEHSVARFSSVLIIIISVSSTVFIATSDLSTSESLAFSIIAVGIGIKMVEMFSGFMWRIPSVILIGFIVWIFLYVISVTLTISVENDIHHTVLVFFTFLPIMNSIFDFLSIGLTRFLLQKSLSSKYPPVLGVIDAIGAIVLFVFLKLGLVTLFVTLSDSDGNSIFQLLGAEGLFVDLKKNPNEYIWLYFTLFSTLIPTIAHLNIACFSLVATKSKYFSGLIRKLSLAILNYRKNINSASISFMALSFIITILIIVPLYSIYSIWMFLYGNHVSILEASLFLSTSWAEYLLKLI